MVISVLAFGFIYLLLKLVPVVIFGISLFLIRNITVQQQKNNRMMIMHFILVVLDFATSFLTWIVLFTQLSLSQVLAFEMVSSALSST
jgi:hypothetical protein